MQRLRAGISCPLCRTARGEATEDLVVFQLCRTPEEQAGNQIR